MSERSSNAGMNKAAAARAAETENVDPTRDTRPRFDMVHPAGKEGEDMVEAKKTPEGAQSFGEGFGSPALVGDGVTGSTPSANAAAASGGLETQTPPGSLEQPGQASGAGSLSFNAPFGFPGLGADGPPPFAGPPSGPGDNPDRGGPPRGGDDGGSGQPNLAPVRIKAEGGLLNENAEAGTRVATLDVIDPNQDDTHTLRIVEDSPFEIVNGELRVREGAELNFEEQSAYELTVEATDSAGNTYQQVIPVEIGDVNEAPTHIGLDGQSVAENSAGGTVVGSLSALDPDFKDTHSYEIVGDSGGTPLSEILLDDGHTYTRTFNGDDSGKQGTGLRLVSEGRIYDGEGEAQAAVWRVRNAGEEAQEVTLDIVGGGGERTVEVPAHSELFLTTEDIGTAKLLFGDNQLDVKAAGSQDFGEGFGAMLVGGGEPDPFEIVDGKLVVREGAELDFESQQSHEVTIRATDEGGLNTTKTFDINVGDVLEAPEVTASNGSGIEDQPLDLSPLMDIATGGQAGNLSVQVAGVPEGAKLSAGQDNGDGTWSLALSDLDGLTLTPPQNSDEDFTLNVTATMTGEGGETASTTAKLTVSLDAVADAPKLALAGGDMNEIVLRVAADSWKGDPNLRLEVDGETVGNWKVTADHGAGEWETIRVTGDFGPDGPQEVKVGFTNDAWGGTPDTDRNLYVDRIEVNGQAYEAEGEGVDYGHRDAQEAMKWAGNLTFDTSDNPGPNAGIAGDEDTAIPLDLSAALTDTDGSESLSVTVTGLPEGAKLSAGQDNGDGTWTLAPADLDGLALTPPQDYNGNFTLQVTATATEAANGDAASTTIEVPVEVNAVNDAPTTPSLGFIIPENAEGALAGMISASDPDEGDTLEFSVSDERFEVKDGVLKLKDGESLDHEAEPFVKLSVTATDSHGASASQDFTVSVWDVNEAPTGIEPGGFTVEENAPGGTLLATLSAIDPDSGDTHSYEVLGDYAEGIEVRGNQLFLKEGVDIDYEEGAEHSIPVKVTDSAGNNHVEVITATIQDVNEGPQAGHIPDQKAGPDNQLDLNVSSYFTDEDIGDTLTYSAEGPDWLSIDPETGQLSGAPQPAEQVLEMQGGLYDLPAAGKILLETDVLSSIAGFNNSVGYYLADGEGNPLSGGVLNLNAKELGAGKTEIDLAAEPGAKGLGLFIVPNGANKAGDLSDGDRVEFTRTDDGWQANWGPDGQPELAFFSDKALNPDGIDHVTDNFHAGELNWEDILGGGDRDFSDVNMTAKVTALLPQEGGSVEEVTITATDEGGLSVQSSFSVAVDGEGRDQAAEFLLFDSGEDQSDFDGTRGGWMDIVRGGGPNRVEAHGEAAGNWLDHIDRGGKPEHATRNDALYDDADPSVSPADDGGIPGGAGHEIDKMDWN